MLNKKKILKDFVTDFVTHSTFNRLGLQINRFRRFCLRRANVILSCHLSVLQSVSELLLLKKNCREILYLFFPPIFVYTLQFRLNSDKIGRHFPQWDLQCCPSLWTFFAVEASYGLCDACASGRRKILMVDSVLCELRAFEQRA